MKNTIWKMLLMACTALAAIMLSSCEDEPAGGGMCHVTLVCNAAPGTAEDTLEFDVEAGTLLTGIPELAREGFEFAGWYSDQSSANNTKPDAVIAYPMYDLTKTPVYLDVTLYGRWIVATSNQ